MSLVWALLLLEHDFSGGFRQFLGAACGLSPVSHPGDAVMALKVKAGLWKLGLRQQFRPRQNPIYERAQICGMIETCKPGSFIRLLSNVYIGNQGLDSFVNTNSQGRIPHLTSIELNLLNYSTRISLKSPFFSPFNKPYSGHKSYFSRIVEQEEPEPHPHFPAIHHQSHEFPSQSDSRLQHSFPGSHNRRALPQPQPSCNDSTSQIRR